MLPMYFVFCRLCATPHPNNHGRVWLLPVISRLLTNIVSPGAGLPIHMIGEVSWELIPALRYPPALELPVCCVQDNVAIQHVMASYLPGHYFPEGRHHVLYQATDADGNRARQHIMSTFFTMCHFSHCSRG
jgi:hypothetical protein